MWNGLPADLWAEVCDVLGTADVRSLGGTCRSAREASVRTMCARGVTLRGDTRVLDASWAEGIKEIDLRMHALPAMKWRRAGGATPELWRVRAALSTMRASALDTLRVRFGANAPVPPDFWDVAFAACPALRVVEVTLPQARGHRSDERMAFCERLVELGAPRLRELRVMSDHAAPPGTPLVERRAVRSTTLHKYAVSWCATATPVDCPDLRELEVRDQDFVRPLLPRVLTDTAKERLETAAWELTWGIHPNAFARNDDAFEPGFRGFRALGECRALRRLSLDFCGLEHAAPASALLEQLRNLPAGLRELDVRLDLYRMEGRGRCRVEWPKDALARLRLDALTVRATFPPGSTADLLGHWMGAAPARPAEFRCVFDRTVDAAYVEKEEAIVSEAGSYDSQDDAIAALHESWREAAEPQDPAPLLRYLDRHPGLTVRLRNANVTARHPRLDAA